MRKRLTEIDALRGLAVALMVVYHFLFDGSFMGLWEMNFHHWFIELIGLFVRTSFLGLVGVSVVLSSRNFWGQFKRGAMIFTMGMLVTAATLIVVPEMAIWFGILHFIGFSIPLLRLFKGKPWIAAATALCIAGLYGVIQGTLIDSPWLLWLGIPPVDFMSLDYFPLIPWLSLPLAGVAVGHWIYGKKQATRMELLAKIPGLTWMGKRALAIYMIHQPVILAGLWVYSQVK